MNFYFSLSPKLDIMKAKLCIKHFHTSQYLNLPMEEIKAIFKKGLEIEI